MQNFDLSLHYNYDKSYLYVHKIQICKFKDLDNLCRSEFYSGSVPKDFTVNEMKQISVWGNVYYFSSDFGLISIANILNFRDVLIKKHHRKLFIN